MMQCGYNVFLAHIKRWLKSADGRGGQETSGGLTVPNRFPIWKHCLFWRWTNFFSVQKIIFSDLPEQYIDTFLSPPFDIVV